MAPAAASGSVVTARSAARVTESDCRVPSGCGDEGTGQAQGAALTTASAGAVGAPSPPPRRRPPPPTDCHQVSPWTPILP